MTKFHFSGYTSQPDTKTETGMGIRKPFVDNAIPVLLRQSEKRYVCDFAKATMSYFCVDYGLSFLPKYGVHTQNIVNVVRYC